MRTLAFGDIHGCSRLLDTLLAAVQPATEDKLIFLGDYVDRGPDTKGTIDRLIALQATHDCVFLRGNHELMMTRARSDKSEARMWMQVGGAQALGSYGSAPGRSGRLEDIPDAHWQFIDDCRDYYETDTHVFVHAKLEPDTPLEEQTELWLQWEFLDEPVAHVSGKTMICGHSSQKNGRILDLGTAICIDTFAYGGGHLTCLCAETREYWQVDIMSRVHSGVL